MYKAAEYGVPLTKSGPALSGSDPASRSERPLAIALVTIVFAWSIVFAITLVAGRPAQDSTHLLSAAAEISTSVPK